MERYVYKNGKRLRYGYTTGSCACAASKAAILLLKGQELGDHVRIRTPKGWEIEIPIHKSERTAQWAKVTVIKDAGDDPDVTNGMEIVSIVEIKPGNGQIHITGGEGIGIVTKPGMGLEVGKHAINKTPQEMIRKELSSFVSSQEDVYVKITAPTGEKIAKRTFNAGIGIVGGISIIGTTGIVEPMSHEAYERSLELELKMEREQGKTKAILSPGNYGMDYGRSIGMQQENIIKYSNYLGFVLEKSVELGFEEVLIIGNFGKMVKVAGGIFNTHSRVADGRREIMATYSVLSGGRRELVSEIMGTFTTDEALGIIEREGLLPSFCRKIGDSIYQKINQYVYEELKVRLIVFSTVYGELYKKGFEDE